MKDTLKQVFNLVYLHSYGEEYNFRNKKVEKQLTAFIEIIPDSAGEDWLMEFTVFQFSYYSKMKTRFDRIYLNWIYGVKALKRWSERTEAQVYYARQFKQELGIKKEFQKLAVSEFRDSERMRFKDMSRQLLHCDELSLLEVGNHICNVCPMYKTCLLKK
jgi:hypothetical protein